MPVPTLEDFGEPAFLIVPNDHHRLDAKINVGSAPHRTRAGIAFLHDDFVAKKYFPSTFPH